jgi:hypothetical protein
VQMRAQSLQQILELMPPSAPASQQ